MDGTPTIDPLAAPEARLLSLSPDLLGALDPDGLIALVNPAWTTALGWSEDELVGRPFRELVHPEDVEAAAVLTGAAPAAPITCRLTCSGGGDRTIEWSVAAAPAGVYLAGRDVTERERLAEELQDFAYVASHDLAEPLRMVTSYLELLERRYGDQLDETAGEFIGYAVGGAERMKAMIAGLLAFSRVGTHELEPAEFDLRELLGSPLAEGVRFAEPLVPVHGDPAQIAQLLGQLVDNALKFRAPDREPTVTISTAEEDGGVRIDVADEGLGIDERHHERIFKTFARLHGRDDYEGTGIGLALCRRIAERHGGRVTVASQPGAGSVFSVWLPR